jgi:hypothetical protein
MTGEWLSWSLEKDVKSLGVWVAPGWTGPCAWTSHNSKGCVESTLVLVAPGHGLLCIP